jgi:hypothetical protein
VHRSKPTCTALLVEKKRQTWIRSGDLEKFSYEGWIVATKTRQKQAYGEGCMA